jgi:uncharacterized membrane protein
VGVSGKGSVEITQKIQAPAESVAAYISDFRNAKEWMVGVHGVERLSEDEYRLLLETPAGNLEPHVRVVEHSDGRICWIYTSLIEGGGWVEVRPLEDGGSLVSYRGEFRLKSRVLDRAARLVGLERFARLNGERSLTRLRYIMEARRY